MEKFISGRTIEEAIEKACTELNISKKDFSYEVVDLEKKGFLGIGTKPARIKVVYQVSPEKMIGDYLRELFSILGVHDYNEKIEITGDNVIDIQLDGEQLTYFTLKHTDIVESLQFILVMTLNKQLEDHYKVTLNINDYKEKSASRIEALAVKTANQVLKTRKKAALYPMSAYQRRIVHSRLQSFENITTYSVGMDPNRKVVVAYQGASGEKGGFRKPFNKDRGASDNRSRNSSSSPDKKPYKGNRGGKPFKSPSSETSSPLQQNKVKQIYPKPVGNNPNFND